MLTRIDELTRDLYVFLGPDDECYFLREYTSNRGYTYSATNSIISNIKKPVDRRGKPEWFFKERDIERVARELAASLNLPLLRPMTLVPAPPSACKSDPAHDDRLVQILSRVDHQRPLDIRELVLQQETTSADHVALTRRSLEELIENYRIDESAAAPPPTSIVVFDDVLTTGRHFVAMKRILQARFGNVPVRGVFIARRIFAQDDENESLL